MKVIYKKMLVPLDGSPLAEIALSYARELAGMYHLELTVLHVCEQSGSESEFMCESYVDRTAESLRTGKIPTGAGIPERAAPVEVKGIVTSGHPAERIIDYASDNGIDIILMATHGLSGMRRWLMGSVADKVLRASPVPVWLVRETVPEETMRDEWPERVLLVPLDGSPFAEAVLPHVEALARQPGDSRYSVVLLRVFEKPFVTADYPRPDWEAHVRRMSEYFKQEAENYLAKVSQRLAGAGLKVRTEALAGKPEDEIIEYAAKNHAELVIITSHGSSLATRWEYGNVADKVLRGVPSPVFLVRPKRTR